MKKNKMIMFIFSFLSFLILPFFSVFGSSKNLEYTIHECGTYQVHGVAEKKDDEFFLTFFKGSKSEIKLMINDPSNLKVLPYLDKEVAAEIVINKLPEFQKGEATIIKISDLFIDAIKTEDRFGFKLLKKSKCILKTK